MATTTLAMVATVFVLNLYNMKEKPVPPWAKRYFVEYLSRVMCMCSCSPGPSESSKSSSYERDKHAYRLIAVKAQDDAALPLPQLSPLLLRHNNGLRERRLQLPESPAPTARPTSPTPSKSSAVDYNKEWVHVAAVCDRLFFWLCLLFIIATTLMLFHPLSTSKLFER
jgi:hypothetical protein